MGIRRIKGVNFQAERNIEYLGVREINLSSYFGTSYRRWENACILDREGSISFSGATIPEGVIDTRVFIYNFNNNRIQFINQLFTPFWSCVVDSDNYYFGIYDFPEGGTQAGLLVVNKKTLNFVRHSFGYHTAVFGQAKEPFNYIFIRHAHGEVLDYIRYYDKTDGQIKNLTVFPSEYSTINTFGSSFSYNRKILVSTASYYSDQTFSYISMIDIDNLQVNRLGTVTGPASIGVEPIFYNNNIFIHIPNSYLIRKYNTSLSLLSSYTLNTNFTDIYISECFPLDSNDTLGEPLGFYYSSSFGVPCVYQIFNFATEQLKTLDLSIYLPGKSGFKYFPRHKKGLLYILEANPYNVAETIKIHIFRINKPTLWEAI